MSHKYQHRTCTIYLTGINMQDNECQTTRTISEDKSARKRGLVGPYVKTTRTVLLFYNIVQYLYVYNY